MTEKINESNKNSQNKNNESHLKDTKHFQKLSGEHTSCNTFLEYFYIFGINEKIVRKEEFYTKKLFTDDKNIRMQLISKFPPFEKPNSNIDENVIMSHCFPEGFTFKNQNDFPKHEGFHFSLDNLNSLGIDDKKIYFTCLLFYEALSTYYEVLIRYFKYKISKSVNKNNEKKIDKLKTITPKLKKLMDQYYIPKVICFSSFVPFPNEEKYLLTKLLAYVSGMTKGIQNNIVIPIEKIIEKLILGIPRPPKGKFHITYRNNNCIIPNNENDYNIIQRELNQYNYYSYKMHLIFIFKTDDIMEIIKCLLLEIPILFFSKNKEKLTNIFETFLCLISPFEYQYPHVSILPNINAGIIEMAKSFAFGINDEWIKSINKDENNDENKDVIKEESREESKDEIKDDNKDKNKDEIKDENKDIKQNYFERLNLNVFNKLIKIVDIDNRKLINYKVHNQGQKIVDFKDLQNDGKDDFSLSSKEINYESNSDVVGCEFPLHYIGKFKKRLTEFLDNNKMKGSDCNMALNRTIGEDYFYYFFVCVFQNYNKYLFNTEEETKKICKEIREKNNDDEIPINHLCKISEFLNEFKGGDVVFLNRFFSTKIFKNFLIRKYLNNDIDKFIFLHFDETILSKRNRSFFKIFRVKTEFLESKILQVTHCYGVDTAKNFSQEEYGFITSHEDELINYNQRFNGSLFNYYLFPKLIYDSKYFQKIYIPPKFFDKFLIQQMQDYQKSIEALGQPKYFKIYNGELVIRHLHNCKNDLAINEIKNDVLLLWLRVFCLTFYYCEPKEKIIRFVELLENVKKAIYLKDDILSLLLITIKKFGDEAMTIKFFEKFKCFKYNQFAYLANKLYYPYMKKPPEKQLSIANSKLCINYFKDKDDVTKVFELNIKKIDYKLKHRTLWGDGIQGKSEKLKFENPICPQCKKANSLKKLLTNYEKMNKEKTLECMHCNQMVNFTTIVKLGYKSNGEEININLYNPYYLYNIISTQLIKLYGNMIDLNDLRNTYKDFFWNCILNFKLAGLSCDMLLKYNKYYKVKVEEIKKEVVVDTKKKGKGDKNKKDSNDNKIAKFTNLEISKNVIDIKL